MPLSPQDDPIAIFQDWLALAEKTEAIAEPTAMTLATVDAEGLPDARIVLLKAMNEDGFVFYTNLGSRKAQQLADNPRAALCFYWMPLDRQVRVRGTVVPVREDEADAYFRSRPRESRIGAWASRQSEPMPDRFALEKRVAKYAARYPLGEVPRPAFWSGYRLAPRFIEFWQKQAFRLHDRVLFEQRDDGGGWQGQRLYP